MVDIRALVIAHGVLASLAWVIFFPLGAVLVRVLSGPATWKVHASIQLFSMAMFTAAVGTGLSLAMKFKKLNHYHVIIGLTIFSVMFFQAVAGLLHHVLFKKQKRRTTMSYVHLWLGRALITLGMINGGLGLKLNGRATRAQLIAYGVVAGVIWSGWLVTSAIASIKKGRSGSLSGEEKRTSAHAQRTQQWEAKNIKAYKEHTLAESASNESVSRGR